MKIEKPWGHELVWARTDRYVGKVLEVRAGHALSRQYHRVKDETMLVISGEVDMEVGDPPTITRMGPGSTIHLSPMTIHRLVAVTDTRIVEVSTPELDDVVRLEDRYGRAG